MASLGQVVDHVVKRIQQDEAANILVVVRSEAESERLAEELNDYVRRGLIKGFSRNVQFVWFPESGEITH